MLLLHAYLCIRLDARHRSREPKLRAIAIGIGVSEGLHCVQIGRCQDAVLVIHMIQYELAHALRIWIIVVDTVPNANVAVSAGRDHMTAKVTNLR